MTNYRLENLSAKRQELVNKIAAERTQLQQLEVPWRRPSKILGKVSVGIRFVKDHPETLLLPVAITVLSHPRRFIAMAVSGYGLWRMARAWRRRIFYSL